MSANVINAFISNARQKLANLCGSSAVHVVLGNESCDLDSSISAVIYGLLIAEETKTDGNIAVLPVLNIPRADVPLKTEIVYFLKQNSIHYEDIPCRDEIDLQSLHQKGKLSLSLVDHHQLFGSDLSLVPSISRILDHRAVVAEALAELPSSAKVTIEPVGSCCTLVAQEILDRRPSLLSACVARLLKGTILLDTVCFSEQAGRTTPLDVQAVEQCEKVERSELFLSLVNARKDVSQLTPSQLLRKDMKVVDGLPVPGMPELVSDFAKRAGAEDALKELCEMHESSVAVVIGMIIDETSGAVTRDIAVFEAIQGEKASRLKAKLLEAENLQLCVLKSPIPQLTLFSQGNVKATRKQILPVLRSVE